MNKLFRFAPDGRCLGFIVQDRPIEQYADRTDLTTDQPPNPPLGYHPYREGASWVLRVDPPPPEAPPRHQPEAPIGGT